MSDRAAKNLICLIVLLVTLIVARQGGVSAPMPEPGLHVLIVEESALRTAEQAAAINSVVWQQLVAPGNWRVVDPIDDNGQAADFSKLEPKWQAALARPRGPVPWVIVSNAPHGGYEGPLVASELVPLVQKWGAKQ